MDEKCFAPTCTKKLPVLTRYPTRPFFLFYHSSLSTSSILQQPDFSVLFPCYNQQPKLYLPMLKSSNQMSNIRLAKSDEVLTTRAVLSKFVFSKLYHKANVSFLFIYQWFNDCSDDIRICCLSALDNLNKHYGWQVLKNDSWQTVIQQFFTF